STRQARASREVAAGPPPQRQTRAETRDRDRFGAVRTTKTRPPVLARPRARGVLGASPSTFQSALDLLPRRVFPRIDLVREKSALGFLTLRRGDLDIARRARNVIPQVLNAEDLLRDGQFVGISMFRLTTHLALLTSSGKGRVD